jgi:hypothetical protein
MSGGREGGREGRGGGWRVGQKVLSKPSADSFAVGRRQKGVSKNKNISLIVLKLLFLFVARCEISDGCRNANTIKKLASFTGIEKINLATLSAAVMRLLFDSSCIGSNPQFLFVIVKKILFPLHFFVLLPSLIVT